MPRESCFYGAFAFVSDHSPAEGGAPNERADPLEVRIELRGVSSDQRLTAAPAGLGLSPALVTDAEGGDLSLTCSSRGAQIAGGFLPARW